MPQQAQALETAQNGSKPTRIDDILASARNLTSEDFQQITMERDYWRRSFERLRAYTEELEAQVHGA